MLTRFISQIIFFTLLSKILGFLRDLLITSEYGLSSQTDSYFIAVIVCTIFFNLTNSGLISSLMIVSGSIHNQNQKNNYFSNFLIIFFFISLLITSLIYFWSPNLVKIFAYGFSDDKANLSYRLVKSGSLIVVFNFITSILIAYHQDRKKFITPAAQGIVLNIPLIIYLLFFNTIYGIEGLMVATLIGYILQSIINIMSAYVCDSRFLPKRNIINDNSALTFKLMLPIFLGSIAGFINTLVDKTMASGLPDGIISAFSISLKFRQLFIGLFILSIITPLYSFLTKEIDKNELINLSKKGMNLILFSAIPITMFLVFFSKELITVVFQHGTFNEADTKVVSNSLIFYSLGIIGVGSVGFFTKIFFALKQPKIPMIIAIVAVILNIFLNIVLINPLGYIGLPLATSLTSLVSCILLFSFLRERKILAFSDFSNSLIKCFVSSCFSIMSIFIISSAINVFIIPQSNYLVMLIILPLFFIIYIISSFFLKLDPSVSLISILKKKILF